MVRVESLPPSSTIHEGKRDEQESSFEDVLKRAYGDFPKLKMHADMHPSEYEHTISVINGLPAQLQDKWKLLRLCLWHQYGSSVFGEVFNLTPEITRNETAFLSDLPDELTDMISGLLKEEDDVNEEEMAGSITSETSSKKRKIRVNQEKREFVILAEGGSKWKTLTDNERFVLVERYLTDIPKQYSVPC